MKKPPNTDEPNIEELLRARARHQLALGRINAELERRGHVDTAKEFDVVASAVLEPTMAARSIALLQEQEGPWRAADVVDELRRRGIPLTVGAHAAVRVALNTYLGKGYVERVGRGLYRAATWTPRPPESS